MSLLLRVGGVPGWKTRRKEGCTPCRKCETLAQIPGAGRSPAAVIHFIGRQKRMLGLGDAALGITRETAISISTPKR